VRQAQLDMLRQIFRLGSQGEVTEVAPVGEPWGFRLEDIAMAVHLWDGDQISLIPPTHARYLVEALPSSYRSICPGEGHLLLVDRMDELLRASGGGASNNTR
jgi:hypothetical protein